MPPKRGAAKAAKAKEEKLAKAWATLEAAWKRCEQKNRGCLHCGRNCLMELRSRSGELQQFRKQFAELPAEVQDVHLGWMFHHTPAELSEALPLAKRAATSTPDQCATSDDEPQVPDPVLRQPAEQRVVPAERFDTSDEEPQRFETSDSEQEAPANPSASSAAGAASSLTVPSAAPALAKRASRYSIDVLGQPVCLAAARSLVGVGFHRLTRIRRGELDGRRGQNLDRNTKHAEPLRSCTTFLWRMYHQVAEGMPDKFSSAKRDSRSATIQIAAAGPQKAKSEPPEPTLLESDSDLEDAQETEDRFVSGVALAVAAVSAADVKAATGPGVASGPLRFLPPGKKIHLRWEYAALQRSHGLPAASYWTFCRAFRQVKESGLLRFRKVGSHAKCTVCEGYKKELRQGRLTLRRREQILELYTKHLIDQWLDRQVYENMQDLSRTCLQHLRDGHRWAAGVLSTSVLTVILDGMDQAKFRVPRKLVRSHAFERLLRPALHVQGIWAHGACYQLAVTDNDVMKDTAANLEVLCRTLSDLYDRHETLPLGLHVQQDNTSRECKNQKVVQFAIALVATKVFRWVTLSYLVTGHTHTGLDATFGQLTVKLSMQEFCNDTQVVELLNRFAGELGIDQASRDGAKAYKLDEVAPWPQWAEQHGVFLSNLTGPDAPHYFRICLRSDVANGVPTPHSLRAETQPRVRAEVPVDPSPEDVMLVVKDRMHSLEVSQVLLALPAGMRRRMLRRPQPLGLHPRRPGGEAVKAKVAKVALELGELQVISPLAKDYLVDWARGIRPRCPRPLEYSFLRHRWQPEARGPGREPLRHDGGSGRVRAVRLSIVGISGRASPDSAEEEADQGVFVEVGAHVLQD